MRTKSVVLGLALCLIGAAVALAADAFIGTWKLNAAKSKVSASGPNNTTVVYEAAGDSIKITTDGTSADGKPAHSEWTGKFDGKEYAVSGDANADMRSYKKVNDHTLTFVNKKGGKVNVSGKITVSSDGKTRTTVLSGTGADGKKFTSTAVYDKQ